MMHSAPSPRGDRALRRGLKTAVGLLQAAALRVETGPAVQARREDATRALLGELAAAGVPVDGGLEPAAVEVERRPEHAPLRPRVRRHLLEDLAAERALLGPLEELYQ
jgi:hypothetical protein